MAFSSLAQDEIGHARAFYELRAQLTGEDPDEVAFGRPAERYRHARLLDHPRNDWAFSLARRYLYDTADAVRLGALAHSSWQPLADLVAKIRREETYHLMHLDAWLRRLANGGDEPRAAGTGPDGAVAGRAVHVRAARRRGGADPRRHPGRPMSTLASAPTGSACRPVMAPLGIAMPGTAPRPTRGRTRRPGLRRLRLAVGGVHVGAA